MAESVYKIIELVGTSSESWEKAATAAVARASSSLRDLRIAEVAELDLQIEGGQHIARRSRSPSSTRVASNAPGDHSSPLVDSSSFSYDTRRGPRLV